MTNAIEPRRPIPPAPIHPLAALTIIVLDNVFGWIELFARWRHPGTSLLVGGLGFLSTLFVQRYLAKDEWGASVAKGLVMGIIAGVPFQVTGTAVGAVLLGWAGRKPVDQTPVLASQTGTTSRSEMKSWMWKSRMLR